MNVILELHLSLTVDFEGEMPKSIAIKNTLTDGILQALPGVMEIDDDSTLFLETGAVTKITLDEK